MASLGRLVAGVAHELNNPISFVLGNVHVLKRYGERLGRYLEAIHALDLPPQAAGAARRVAHRPHRRRPALAHRRHARRRAAHHRHRAAASSAFPPWCARRWRRWNCTRWSNARSTGCKKGTAPRFEIDFAPGEPVHVMGNAGRAAAGDDEPDPERLRRRRHDRGPPAATGDHERSAQASTVRTALRRQRSGHRAGAPVAHLRSVLHHQERRQGHRAWACPSATASSNSTAASSPPPTCRRVERCSR